MPGEKRPDELKALDSDASDKPKVLYSFNANNQLRKPKGPLNSVREFNPVSSSRSSKFPLPTINRDPDSKILFSTSRLNTLKNQEAPIGSVQQKFSPFKDFPGDHQKIKNVLTVNDVEYLIEKKIGSGGSSIATIQSRKFCTW